MTPSYFFGLDCLEPAHRYLKENGFLPISVTMMTVTYNMGTETNVVPAIAAIRKSKQNDGSFISCMIFGRQWEGDGGRESGAEFVLLADVPFENTGEEHETPLVIGPDVEVKRLTWQKAA